MRRKKYNGSQEFEDTWSRWWHHVVLYGITKRRGEVMQDLALLTPPPLLLPYGREHLVVFPRRSRHEDLTIAKA